MLCHDVKRVVYFFLDGTLDERRNDDFKHHIDACADCEARIIVHRRIRVFLRKRLTPLPAPDHLKQRLVRTLRAVAE